MSPNKISCITFHGDAYFGRTNEISLQGVYFCIPKSKPAFLGPSDKMAHLYLIMDIFVDSTAGDHRVDLLFRCDLCEVQVIM